MPGTGYGFPSYPQRPSVSASDVGALLTSRAQAGEPAPGAIHPSAVKGGLDSQGGQGGVPPVASTLTGVPPRLLAAYQDSMQSGGSEAMGSALSIALREADRRGPPGPAQQRMPAGELTHNQLLRFGISPAELQILRLSGAVK